MIRENWPVLRQSMLSAGAGGKGGRRALRQVQGRIPELSFLRI